MKTCLNLSSKQKQLYLSYFKALSNNQYNLRVPFSVKDTDDFTNILKLILSEHPEFINYDNSSLQYANLGIESLITLNPLFLDCSATENIRAFQRAADDILLKIINPKSKTVQQVLSIYEYMVSSYSYDYDAYNYQNNSLSYHAYGAIMNKKAVCEGFSHAFCYFTHRLHIPSVVVNGFYGSEAHAWNIVLIDNEFFHIDITYGLQKTPGQKKYDYFCLKDSDLSKRNWDKSLYPKCTSEKYNFFNVARCFAHNDNQLNDIVLQQLRKGKEVYVKFDYLGTDRDSIIKHIWRVIQETAIDNGISLGHVTYSLNEELPIFFLHRD